jgi:hypothetical protein
MDVLELPSALWPANSKNPSSVLFLFHPANQIWQDWYEVFE